MEKLADPQTPCLNQKKSSPLLNQKLIHEKEPSQSGPPWRPDPGSVSRMFSVSMSKEVPKVPTASPMVVGARSALILNVFSQ